MELKILRIRAGMSQAAAAEKLGVSQAAVCSWEKGDYKPSPAQRDKLAEAYGVSLAEIVKALEEDHNG
jgi:transcriptional regulator with XRE-family HTH domain